MQYWNYQLATSKAYATMNEERWSYRLSKFLPPNYELEREIDILRQRLEKLVDEEMSFTSEAVVEISSILDKKIFEYMKLQQKSR